MKFYKVTWTFNDADALQYMWSRDKRKERAFRAPVVEHEWTPPHAIRFEHGGPFSYGAKLKGGRLTDRSRAEFQKLWVVTEPKTRSARDTIGGFSILLFDIPLVSHRLKTAIEGCDSGPFEFVEFKNVWDTLHDCPVEGGPFYLANLLARIDSLDKDASEIYSIPRSDGTSFNTVRANRCFISESAALNATIWRDSAVAEVFCTSEFRALLEAAGCRGWHFVEVPVSPR